MNHDAPIPFTLTDKAREALTNEPVHPADAIYNEYVRMYVRDGIPPTLRMVVRALGYSTTSAVHYHVERLVREGRLYNPREGRDRGYVPVGYKVVPVGDSQS